MGAQKLIWQGPTRPLSQLPSSSSFEQLQHELEQTTAQEESLLPDGAAAEGALHARLVSNTFGDNLGYLLAPVPQQKMLS